MSGTSEDVPRRHTIQFSRTEPGSITGTRSGCRRLLFLSEPVRNSNLVVRHFLVTGELSFLSEPVRSPLPGCRRSFIPFGISPQQQSLRRFPCQSVARCRSPKPPQWCRRSDREFRLAPPPADQSQRPCTPESATVSFLLVAAFGVRRRREADTTLRCRLGQTIFSGPFRFISGGAPLRRFGRGK